MLVEQVLERQAARFARRLEPGRQELHVVGEPGRPLPAGVALAIERLHVADGGAGVAVEREGERRVHADLERAVGARRLVEQIGGAAGNGCEEEGQQERQRLESDPAHHRYCASVALFHASKAAKRDCPSGFSLTPSQTATL